MFDMVPCLYLDTLKIGHIRCIMYPKTNTGWGTKTQNINNHKTKKQ